MDKLINSANDTYLIAFQNSVSTQIICEWDQIQNGLKKLNEGFILENIYRFTPTKKKFERVPKKSYNTLFKFNTEAIEILRKFNLTK